MFDPALWWYNGRRMKGRTMGQVLHGSATTTEAVRRAIQARQESVRAAAKRYGISATTVQKWRSRQTSTDARMGPKEPRSSVLSVEDEAVIVAFRRHTLLPLDDCLYALQPTIPHLTRSSLHHCLQRHGISRLPRQLDKNGNTQFLHEGRGAFDVPLLADADKAEVAASVTVENDLSRTKSRDFEQLAFVHGVAEIAHELEEPKPATLDLGRNTGPVDRGEDLAEVSGRRGNERAFLQLPPQGAPRRLPQLKRSDRR
jgi:transposase